jgi:anti-sigma regulatory factor (Ser/Thr protein kinase)
MGNARQRRHGVDRGPAGADRGDRVEWTLEPADTSAVNRLRHQIMQTLARIATPNADLSPTEIVVAELLTNALAHTAGRAWVSLRWDGVHPLLSVADLGPGFAMPSSNGGSTQINADRTLVPRLPDDPLAEGGRGLFLVAHFALDVAVAARATGGTVVSVTLDLKRAS